MKPLGFIGMVGRVEIHGRVVDGQWVETVTFPPDITFPQTVDTFTERLFTDDTLPKLDPDEV